jgi:MoaA/NifB/PqqE/SkfB family radical SAM enzyme
MSEKLKQRVMIRHDLERLANKVLCNAEYFSGKKRLASRPYAAYLNTTNVCNLRCRFCEIHYFYSLAKKVSGRVFPNNLDLETLNRHMPFLKYMDDINISSSTGEPFANRNIGDIIARLKRDHINLTCDTNGLLINPAMAETLVEQQFNTISVSVHGGDKDTYYRLQGGDFDMVLANLRYLVDAKRRRHRSSPKININFALNKENAASLKTLIRLMKDAGVDSISLFHYYDSRNRMEEDVSFYHDPDQGNAILKDAYEYAASAGLNLRPSKPAYILSATRESTGQGKIKCKEPWTTVKFKGCVECGDTEYIGVCNRIMLLKLNYEQFFSGEESDFHRDVWNHPVMQYLRETVNTEEKNPICRFCRDPDTPRIRCVDNKKYSLLRDRAIRDFFTEFGKKHDHNRIAGLTLLEDNPYKYRGEDGF